MQLLTLTFLRTVATAACMQPYNEGMATTRMLHYIMLYVIAPAVYFKTLSPVYQRVVGEYLETRKREVR